jgi:hypothetical protein
MSRNFQLDDAGPALHELARALRVATSVAPDLFRTIIAGACPRTRSLAQAGHAGRLDALVGAKAWMDAALELVALEMPWWGLRRLVREGGLWHCSLSRRLALPLELDDMAEAVHDDPALAILAAMIEAMEQSRSSAGADGVAPRADGLSLRLCCDDFG